MILILIIIDREVVIKSPCCESASFTPCQSDDLSEACLSYLVDSSRLRFLESNVNLSVFTEPFSSLLCIFFVVFIDLIGFVEKRVGVVHETQEYQESEECRAGYCEVVIILSSG